MSHLTASKKFLSRILGKEQQKPIDLVAQRFVQAFKDHGVEASQIPRLLPQIQLSDLESPQKLLAALSPAILDQTAELFGIRSQWLEGVDEQIYEYLACYKNPSKFISHLSELQKTGKSADFPFRMLSTSKLLSSANSSYQLLAPVLLETIACLGDQPIYRYHIYRDGFDWEHYPARIELKALARIALRCFEHVSPIFVISENEMRDVLEGKLIPQLQLDGCLITNPSLEDFVLSKEESLVAKEVEELPAVLDYIRDHGLDKLHIPESDAPFHSEQRIEVADTPKDWQVVARSIADQLDAKDAECGAHDSLRGLSDRVAAEMRKRKEHGPRGPLSPGTILREALQGKKWKRNR